MGRKLTGIVILVLMLFGAFTACSSNFDLENYKAEAKLEIERYAQGHKDNYCEDNWTIVCEIVDLGKQTINEAENKAGVDAAVAMVKDGIDEVEIEENMQLSEELENRIKADYLQEFGHELLFGDDLLNKFYGIYNGAAVFFIAGDDAALKLVTISNVEFSYDYGWTIWIWKDGVFYNLENIESVFAEGILTQSDLEKIGVIHAEANIKDANIIINFTLSLGRMDYGSATNIETIVHSVNEWTALEPVVILPELTDKYEASFFTENALIVFALGRGTMGAQFERAEVYGHENDLVVKIFDNGGGYMDMTSNWIAVLEVKKADISSFQNLHLETNFYSFNQ